MSNNVFQNIQLQRIADGIQGGGSSVTVNIDVTGAGDMQGATASAAGAHGLVPAPAAGDEDKVLSGAGTWIDAGGAELGDLEDVTITSPTSGEILKYDGAKWVNGNVTAELPDFIEETSGNLVTVEAAEKPAKSLVVAINPVQSGSGDPSPENVRPISGWTGANVVVSPTIDAEDGQTYNITFPSEAGTVYGGTLDVLSGVLTVSWGIADMGGIDWNYSRIYGENIFTTTGTISTTIPTTSNYTSLMCECYKTVPSTTSWVSFNDKEIKKANTAGFFSVKDTRFNDAATFKSAMSGIHLAYEIKTPITYQLTPTEVKMLLGTNNIWADTGEVKELKYIPQMYNDLLEEVGVSVVTRQIVNTGETWDGNAVMCCVINALGMANGSETDFQLETFGITPPAIQGVRRIELLHNVNGYWANCSGVFWDNSSKYFRGNLSSPLNGSGTLYIFFYFY